MSEEEICRSCQFYATKTEAINVFIEGLIAETVKVENTEIPKLNLKTEVAVSQIIATVYEAFDLESKKNAGATFPYPASLSSWQWLAIEAITGGRNRAESENDKKKPKS